MSITVHLTDPILPSGATITAEFSSGDAPGDLKYLAAFIDGLYAESDKSRDTSPGERALVSRLEQIEKAILNSLPADQKLAIANEAAKNRLNG
jgi:hypothetical protein